MTKAIMTGLAIAGLSMGASAQDIVFDFQEFECSGSGWNPVGAEYKSQGFTFSDGRLLAFCTGDIFYAGSMTLFNDLVGGMTTLTKDSGEAFHLKSIDLAPVLGGGITAAEVEFIGYLGGIEVARQTFMTSAIGRVLEHFEFTGDFEEVDRVTFGPNPFPHNQFDNVTIGGDSAPCYADCTVDGALDFFDFLCYQNAFAAGDIYADCDESGGLDFFDFLCYQNAFAAGCP